MYNERAIVQDLVWRASRYSKDYQIKEIYCDVSNDTLLGGIIWTNHRIIYSAMQVVNLSSSFYKNNITSARKIHINLDAIINVEDRDCRPTLLTDVFSMIKHMISQMKYRFPDNHHRIVFTFHMNREDELYGTMLKYVNESKDLFKDKYDYPVTITTDPSRYIHLSFTNGNGELESYIQYDVKNPEEFVVGRFYSCPDEDRITTLAQYERIGYKIGLRKMPDGTRELVVTIRRP